jgi:hypothetical protein
MNLVIRGYIWFCSYALFIALSFLVLIEVFNFFPQFNQIGPEKFDILEDNIVRTSASYYFPFNLTLVMKSTFERLPFFHKYGTITAIFHEPHTMTFTVFPSLFLMLMNREKKISQIFIIGVFVVYSFIAASVMNIFSLFVTTLIAFSTKYKKLSVIILLVFIYAGLHLLTTENAISDLIWNKIISGSSTYSISTLQFAFSPKTFIGTNFLDTTYAKYNDAIGPGLNVGYVIFTLNLIFLAVLIYKIVYLLLSKNKNAWFIGLFGTYFVVHSIKLALSTYSLSLLLFVIYVINTYYNELKIHNKIIQYLEPAPESQTITQE